MVRASAKDAGTGRCDRSIARCGVEKARAVLIIIHNREDDGSMSLLQKGGVVRAVKRRLEALSTNLAYCERSASKYGSATTSVINRKTSWFNTN